MITQHIWDNYLEICEDIRHARGSKELYGKRKETIKRLFGTAKEHHGFRYTQMVGMTKMEMKVGLTFAYLNLKKLAKILEKSGNMPIFYGILLLLYGFHSVFSLKNNKAGFLLHRKPALSTVCYTFFYFNKYRSMQGKTLPF